MFNLLNLHNKNYWNFFILLLSLNIPLTSFAQTRTRKANAKTSIRVSNKNVRTASSSQVINQSSQNKIDEEQKIDVATITKYNCEDLYNKCMNQTCYNSSNGRCACKDITKFNNANDNCKYIIDACPSLSKNIIETFKRNASNDCLDYSLALNAEQTQTKNINNYVANTLACLQPKCLGNKKDDFVGCFDEDNFNVRFEACKNSYSDCNNIDELKNLINKSFLSYKKNYCNKMFGTFKDDGNCYLLIGIGVAGKDIKAKKEFKIGDKLICSSAFFNTSMGEKIDEKLVSIKNLTLNGISLLQTGLSVASAAVGSKKEVGEKVESETDFRIDSNGNKVPIQYIKGTGKVIMGAEGKQAIAMGVLEGLNTMVNSVGDVYNLATKDYSYTGKCFVIKDGIPHELFPEDDTIAYKLRWAENWDDEIYDI